MEIRLALPARSLVVSAQRSPAAAPEASGSDVGAVLPEWKDVITRGEGDNGRTKRLKCGWRGSTPLAWIRSLPGGPLGGPQGMKDAGRATDERSEDKRGLIPGERRALRDNKRAKRAPKPAPARSETEEGRGVPPDEGPGRNSPWHSCGATDERGGRSEEGAETEEEEEGGAETDLFR